ncbi:unnamed protein product, partial [Trichobilharzia regenti]
MSELKAEYDMLTVNTHLGSVISDYVTSVTKGVSIDSQTSSIIGSVGDDLPTVSTPPRNLGSPVFPETLESSSGQDDGSKFLNTCDLTNSNNSASSHIESVTPAIITKKHDQENGRSNKKQSSAYPKVNTSYNHLCNNLYSINFREAVIHLVYDIMKRLENSLLSRDKVQSELAILKEQLERSKRDQSQLQDQLDL